MAPYKTGDMIRLLPIAALFLAGCLAEPEQLRAPDNTAVEQAIRTARPGPLLALPGLLRDMVPAEPGCPQIDVLEATGGTPTRELWTGGCQLSDGTLIDGSLELLERDDEQWLAGDAFSVTRPTPDGAELELYLDGALEAIEQQDLLLLDAAATWCGGDDVPCTDGPVTVDLSYSIYPASGYPDAYDVTVSGVSVSAPAAPIAVEGSWSIDLAACPGEPTDGVFAFRQDERHDLTLDGSLACDACADWSVQGVPVTDFCGVEF